MICVNVAAIDLLCPDSFYVENDLSLKSVVVGITNKSSVTFITFDSSNFLPGGSK